MPKEIISGYRFVPVARENFAIAYKVAKKINENFMEVYEVFGPECGPYACSCMGFSHHGYCKHRDWLALLVEIVEANFDRRSAYYYDLDEERFHRMEEV